VLRESEVHRRLDGLDTRAHANRQNIPTWGGTTLAFTGTEIHDWDEPAKVASPPASVAGDD
jgi:hypothetical protein